jgi:uncharacterized protein YkwD
MLAIPVISGAGASSPTVQLDSSSTAAAGPESPGGEISATAEPTSEAPGGGVSPAPTPEAEVAAAPDIPESAPAGSPPTEATSTAPGTPTTGTRAPSTSTGPRASTGTPEPTLSEPEDPPAAAPAAPAELDRTAEVLPLINARRADAGCAALAADPALTTAAQAHSAAIAASGELDSDDLDELGGAAAILAESRANSNSVVAGWLADPADSAALLDCSRTGAGIAVVDGWWTTLLA